LLAISACQNGGGKLPVTPRASTQAPATATPTPAAEASAIASRAPDEKPQPLLKPDGPSRVLSGTLSFDAGYMASANVGRALSDSVYAVADASLLSNNGGNIISDHAAGLISDYGGGLIGNNGGSIISDHAAGLTSKVKFGLLSAGPGLGTEQPIAGMLLAVVNLATGEPLALGRNAAGEPVYLIHSDARGHYEVYLPDDLKNNVRVVTGPPGQADARLLYSLVTNPAQATEQRFDEAASVVTNYVRQAMTEQMYRMVFGQGAEAALQDALGRAPAEAVALLEPGLNALKQVCVEEKVTELSPGRIRRITRAWSDAVVARIDLSGIESPPVFSEFDVPTEKALPALNDMFAKIVAGATSRMGADPRVFDNTPWMLAAQMRRAERKLPAAAVRKPSDVARLLNEEFAGGELGARQRSAWLPLADLGVAIEDSVRMRALVSSIYLALLLGTYSDEEFHRELVEIVRRAARAERGPNALPEPVEEPVAVAPFSLPQEEGSYDVQTLVGTGAVGHANGPAKDATVDDVRGLVWDGADALYFTDGSKKEGYLRKVDLKDPAHPVSTVAGGAGGYKDGPLDQALFVAPAGLALEQDDKAVTIYVGDSGRAVRKVSLPKDGGKGAVSTIAGGVPGGKKDDVTEGPGASVNFAALTSLALDGKGGLLVVNGGGSIRRIDLKDATYPVRVVSTAPLGRDGVGGGVHSLTRTADGSVYFTDDTAGRLWRLLPEGGISLVAGAGSAFSFADGYYYLAALNYPMGLTAAPDGSLLISEYLSNNIRRVRLRPDGTGMVTTVTGSATVKPDGFADGTGETARFNEPGPLCMGPNGQVFVADVKNHRIRVLIPRH
jgi:hypothetical protein